LSGEATMDIAGERQTLHIHEGVEVAPQCAHHIVNNSRAEVEFLVISQPSADSDRTTISGNIQLRIARAEDVPQIRSVLLASFLEYEDRYTERAFAATVPTEAELTDRLDVGATWVALFGGRIAGTVSAVPQSRSLHIRSMAVLPRARGKKIGWPSVSVNSPAHAAHDTRARGMLFWPGHPGGGGGTPQFRARGAAGGPHLRQITPKTMILLRRKC
jgi:hypothetical protein